MDMRRHYGISASIDPEILPYPYNKSLRIVSVTEMLSNNFPGDFLHVMNVISEPKVHLERWQIVENAHVRK